MGIIIDRISVFQELKSNKSSLKHYKIRMNSGIGKLFSLQEDNKRDFNSVPMWSLLWEMNCNSDKIIIVWMLTKLIKLELCLKACWTTLKSTRNLIKCFLLWCDLSGMQSFCKGIHLVVWKHIMDVKRSYQVFKFWFVGILFLNCPSYSSRSLFGVFCLLETSGLGTSEDSTESNLLWALDFRLQPSERVQEKVCSRESCVTLGDGEWEKISSENIQYPCQGKKLTSDNTTQNESRVLD